MVRVLVYLRIHSKGWAVETPGAQRRGATEEKTALGNVRHLSNPDSEQVTSQERQEPTGSIAPTPHCGTGSLQGSVAQGSSTLTFILFSS